MTGLLTYSISIVGVGGGREIFLGEVRRSYEISTASFLLAG
jgi:hypothetical protein